jgi:hypothetical protein
MAKSVFYPSAGQYRAFSSFSTPKEPDLTKKEIEPSEFQSFVEDLRGSPVYSLRGTPEGLVKGIENEIAFTESLPEIPSSEELKPVTELKMPEEKGIGLFSDRKYEGGIKETEAKPLTASEKADIAKALSSSALAAGKAYLETEQARRQNLINAKLQQEKDKFAASQMATQISTGALSNYIANLRAAMGKKV